jgi:hypothetical protein
LEFLNNILNLPLAEKVADLHGLFATLSLLVYGAIVTIILLVKKNEAGNLHKPLICLLGVQTLLVGATSTAGIVAYVAYRTAGGAREFLINNPETAWLHSIVFEYKEYLCGITPWLLMMVAFLVAVSMRRSLYGNKPVLRYILISTIVSAVFLLLTSSLAVLVAKVAPLQDFEVGGDLFSRGGNVVVLASIVTAIALFVTFWLVTRQARSEDQDGQSLNSLAAMMYGSAVGLTVMWILNIAKEAMKPLGNSLAYVGSVGPYSGVISWSVIAIVIATIGVRLSTFKMSAIIPLLAAGWILIASAMIQIIAFFPPFYKMLI